MDRALRGNRLTKQQGMGEAGPRSRSKRDTRSDSDDAWHESLSPIEALGVSASGGMAGKPHSTTEGRKYAGARKLTRFWYGRGKEYTDFKKKQKEKKKGIKV